MTKNSLRWGEIPNTQLWWPCLIVYDKSHDATKVPEHVLWLLHNSSGKLDLTENQHVVYWFHFENLSIVSELRSWDDAPSGVKNGKGEEFDIAMKLAEYYLKHPDYFQFDGVADLSAAKKKESSTGGSTSNVAVAKTSASQQEKKQPVVTSVTEKKTPVEKKPKLEKVEAPVENKKKTDFGAETLEDRFIRIFTNFEVHLDSGNEDGCKKALDKLSAIENITKDILERHKEKIVVLEGIASEAKIQSSDVKQKAVQLKEKWKSIV